MQLLLSVTAWANLVHLEKRKLKLAPGEFIQEPEFEIRRDGDTIVVDKTEQKRMSRGSIELLVKYLATSSIWFEMFVHRTNIDTVRFTPTAPIYPILERFDDDWN